MPLPGRPKYLEQWHHKVQCIRDHYPEVVVWESIIQSLKESLADMARYMGPTANVDHILCKLSVLFGTMASFDVLMQNLYKVSQGNKEKVPSFAMRLEGTLKQIQLQCLRMMTEAQQHLRECLFHGVRKHICNSIQYLYSIPSISYSQFMIIVQMAESENEETWDWIRARAAVTT